MTIEYSMVCRCPQIEMPWKLHDGAEALEGMVSPGAYVGEEF